MSDLKFALRQLVKAPGFTTVAVLTLALCVGANLAIFAVLDAVLLRPLPYPAPDRLVTMYNSYPKAGRDRSSSSFLNYYGRRGNIAAFSHIAAFSSGSAIIGESGATEPLEVFHVSPEYFDTLGVNPALGRAFTEEDMKAPDSSSAILTDSYWRQHFNADPAVIGRTVRVDGRARTVVGVLRPDFRFLSSSVRLFLPLTLDVDRLRVDRLHNADYELIGRLKPEATLAVAQAQIDAHNAVQNRDFPFLQAITEAGFRTVVAPLHADHVAAIRSTLWIIEAGVVCLLLIGGVNLVNLLLVRADSRAQEFAIRHALGAGRLQLGRQVLAEILMLVVLGGGSGLALGALGIRLLNTLGIDRLPLGSEVRLDGRVAAVSLLGTLALGVLVALPVLWFNLRRRRGASVPSSSRSGTATHAAQRLRHGFIVAQVALAFVLLAGAGLLGVSLRRALAVAPGFRADHVMTGRFTLPDAHFRDDDARMAFLDRLQDALSAQPGVTAAGFSREVPVSSNHDVGVMRIPGHSPELAMPPIIHNRLGVAGDYFEAMGIPLREGRFLNSGDSHRSPWVCVVDEDFARTYWPGESALGKQVSDGSDVRDSSQWFTVVGVVGAVKLVEVTEATRGRTVYFPWRYSRALGEVYAVARTGLPPESFGLTFQKLVRSLNPELPVSDLRTMEMRLADSLVARRSPALLAGLFALVALLLAAVGTYGVLAYAVGQRRREIGVRMALGALRGQIGRQFLLLGLRLLVMGSVLGAIGAWLVGRAMQGVLFEVPSFHLPTFLAAVSVMTLASLIACLLPALRAARVEPMEALRAE
ncbi:MAG TPA: ABC transporter permease [Candidatus Limnocylindria bacterium]|nr:ABC transporter permease [Candidatus Limnocylindria bacterium]